MLIKARAGSPDPAFPLSWAAARSVGPHPCHRLRVFFFYWDGMQNLVGMIEYLMKWTWSAEPGIVHVTGGMLFRLDAMPFLLDDQGGKATVGTAYVAGTSVFASDEQAFLYMAVGK